MIRLIPRRSAALLATLAFTFAVGEGVLASVCGSEVETDACATGEMAAATAEHAPGPAFSTNGPGGADAAPTVESPPACCPLPSSDAEPRSSGGDDPAPCPFAPMGLGGSCQGASFLGSGELQLLSTPETLPALGSTFPTRDLLFASPPFQPPRI